METLSGTFAHSLKNTTAKFQNFSRYFRIFKKKKNFLKKFSFFFHFKFFIAGYRCCRRRIKYGIIQAVSINVVITAERK